MADEHKMTVGEFRQQLAWADDNDELIFSGGLNFYRFKQRGQNLVQCEFNEPLGDLDEDFMRDYPHVKAVFISTDEVEWDKSGLIGGPIDVSIKSTRIARSK